MTHFDKIDKEMRLRFGATRVNLRHGPLVDTVYYNIAPGVLFGDIEKFAKRKKLRVCIDFDHTSDVFIEIPCSHRQEIFTTKLLKSSQYRESQASLPIIIGVDTFGNPMVLDLTRIPHLLIGGFLGKTQLMHAIILSLITRFASDKCKLVLMDFKDSAFEVFSDLPHLARPIVKNCAAGIDVLRWALDEIDSRFYQLCKHNARNIQKYNETADVPMPYLVVIIDEFCDVMEYAPRRFENYITHIVAKARAVGVHIVMATGNMQRNTITQKIHCYFPTRLSFQTDSATESKVILGESGAQILMDYSDALFSDAGCAPIRIHTAYISDNELAQIVHEQVEKTESKD